MSGSRTRPSYIRVAAGGVADCWRAHPPLFVGLAIVSAMLCAIEVGEIYAMRQLFDSVAEYAEGELVFRDVVAAAVPMAILLVVGPMENILEWLGQGYFWRRGSGYLMARYHERVQRIPLIDSEKSQTFEQMKRAQMGSEDAPSASRSVVQFIFHFIPYLILTSLFLLSVKPALLAALAIIFASVVLAQFLRAGIVRRFEEGNAGLRREREYLEGCITQKEYARETRTLGAVPYFFSLFIDSVRRLSRATMSSERKIAGIELMLRAVNVLGYAGILALLIYYVVNGEITVGAFASVFYSVERMSGVIKSMVEQFGDALSEMSTAFFTYEFLSDEEEDGSTAVLNKARDIHLENVCFTYPGGGKSVLNDINLTIARGETLAIVGENGAGKTTLTKILLGLCDPTSGSMRYGDEDVRTFANSARFSRVSSVFQHYMRYKLTARENIGISDTESGDGVERAAGEAGVDLVNLKDGFDTMLSRDFDGAELSGGQWQRVAIARGLYRGHDMVVLDEPTAAIDPIEESNIFRLFKESARDKTAILVTHRLGSTKIADRILLMDEGQICELGTHEQLMAQGGKYSKMYREQAGWYVR